jgi:hypothetical protein
MKSGSVLTSMPIYLWIKLKQNVWKIFYLFIFLIMIILGCFVFWKYYNNLNKSHSSGLPQKFSPIGNILGTYESGLSLRSFPEKLNVPVASEKF